MPERAKLAAACHEAEPCASDDRVGADYEVGYKKPPKDTRFQPGHSGNPKGRPAGSKSLRTLIDRELGTKVTAREGGRVVALTKRELLVKQLIKRAIEGDHRAQQTLLKFDQEPATSGRAANDDAPLADAPLEPDDRAILDAFVAMLKEGTVEVTEGPDREKGVGRPTDSDSAENAT
jgi:hypothetical protein